MKTKITTIIVCAFAMIVLGASSCSTKAQTTEHEVTINSEVINTINDIINDGEPNADIIDYDIVELYNNTDKDGRNWHAIRYEINNSNDYYEVEYFTYNDYTIINYIIFEGTASRNTRAKIEEALVLDCPPIAEWVKVHKEDGDYTRGVRNLRLLDCSKFSYDDNQSLWLEELTNNKIGIMFTTM